MLEREGLTITDVEIKVIPFPQMGVAFANKAIDAAHRHPAVRLELRGAEDRGAVRRGRRPGAAAADDHRRHHGQHRLGEAEPGAGEQLFHRLAARRARLLPGLSRRRRTAQEIIDALVKQRTERRPELLHKYPWPARSPNGKINVASMLDIQRGTSKNKMIDAAVPGRAADRHRATSTTPSQKLGPFVVENKDSKLPGCR